MQNFDHGPFKHPSPPQKKIFKKLVTFTVFGINQLDNIYILFSDPNDYCMSD